MDLAFATGQVEPRNRLDAWCELINQEFLPLAISPLGSQGGTDAFEASVTGRGLGGLRVWLVKASPMSAVRAWRHIKTSSADDYLLALHVTGTAHAAQDDREVTLGPGDFALFAHEAAHPGGVEITPGPLVCRQDVGLAGGAAAAARLVEC